MSMDYNQDVIGEIKKNFYQNEEKDIEKKKEILKKIQTSILNLGFSSGYIRYYSIYKKDENTDKIYRLNGLFLIVFTIIGIIAFACGTFLAFNLRIVFDQGLMPDEYNKARIMMLMLAVNLAISFPMTVFSCIISAHEKFIFLKSLLMIKTVVGPFITLPLLLMGFRSVAMVIVSVTLSLFTDSIYVYYVLKPLNQKFIFSDIEFSLLKSLFSYSSFIALNIIVDQINWNIDKLLLARFKGTAMVAVYSIGYVLYAYYQTFSTSISGLFTPRIHKIINSTQNQESLQEKLTELFTKIGRVQFIILALLMTGVIFFGKAFIVVYWAGEGYEDSYYVALLLMLPATVTLCQNTGIEIQRAQNKHKYRSILYSITAILNLLFSIKLCQLYGAIGSAFGTFASYFVSSITLMNIYYHRHCNLNMFYYWKNILSLSKGIILPVICGYLYVKIVNIGIFYYFLSINVYN